MERPHEMHAGAGRVAESSDRDVESDESTARSEAERALAVVDALLSSSLVGFGFIDNELRYERVNDALAAINGRPAAEHVGRTVREVLGEQAAAIEPLLRQIIATGEPAINLELSAVPPSTPGVMRSFLASYFPVRTPSGVTLGVGAAIVEITDRKRIEQELLAQQVQFRTLADNIPQLAWMGDAVGWIFWYNARWLAFTGKTFDEVQGWGWQSVQHPDHVERVTEKFRRHLETGEVWEDTFPIRGKDGLYRWFLSRATPIRDDRGRIVRWFGTNTDITEQRFVEEASRVLATSLDYAQTLTEIARMAVPALADWCAVHLVQPNGSILRVANVHADPSKSEQEMAAPVWHGGGCVTRVIRSGTLELATEVTDDLLAATAEGPEHLAALRELGLTSYVIVPLVSRGRTLGAISLACAESGRRYEPRAVEFLQAVAQRAAIAIDNARLYEQVQHSARLREEVLAVVSHDLKNPLAAIHLSAEVLLRVAEPDSRARRPVEAIRRNVSRMSRLIDDLLDVARVQSGRLVLERQWEDAGSILAEVLETHEPAARQGGIVLRRVCSPEGLQVLVDRPRILQVFGNLIGNSIKFCRSEDTITVTCVVTGQEAVLGVSDTGPGIPPEDLPHIFEPYWSSKRNTPRGTGLGLYISRGIVGAHGGRMWVESRVGVGTSFYFALPSPRAGESS